MVYYIGMCVAINFVVLIKQDGSLPRISQHTLLYTHMYNYYTCVCTCVVCFIAVYKVSLVGAAKETLVRAMKLGERLLCVHYVEALMENFTLGEKTMMTMLPEGGYCLLHVSQHAQEGQARQRSPLLLDLSW